MGWSFGQSAADNPIIHESRSHKLPRPLAMVAAENDRVIMNRWVHIAHGHRNRICQVEIRLKPIISASLASSRSLSASIGSSTGGTDRARGARAAPCPPPRRDAIGQSLVQNGRYICSRSATSIWYRGSTWPTVSRVRYRDLFLLRRIIVLLYLLSYLNETMESLHFVSFSFLSLSPFSL